MAHSRSIAVSFLESPRQCKSPRSTPVFTADPKTDAFLDLAISSKQTSRFLAPEDSFTIASSQAGHVITPSLLAALCRVSRKQPNPLRHPADLHDIVSRKRDFVVKTHDDRRVPCIATL